MIKSSMFKMAMMVIIPIERKYKEEMISNSLYNLKTKILLRNNKYRESVKLNSRKRKAKKSTQMKRILLN